jgi:hypothetical protein
MIRSDYVKFASKALIKAILNCLDAAFPQLFLCQFPPCNITQDSFLEFKITSKVQTE